MKPSLPSVAVYAVPCLAVTGSFLLLFGLLPYAYGYGSVPITTFTMLWRLWMDNPDWQHGFMVPFVSIGLVIWDWDNLKNLPVRSDWRGWGLFALALALFYLGFLADIQYLAFFSIQAFVGAGILIFWGSAAFSRLLFPWAFLFFAWPLPFLDNVISFPLRVLMTQISHVFLNLIGVDTLRVGTSLVSAPDFAGGAPTGGKICAGCGQSVQRDPLALCPDDDQRPLWAAHVEIRLAKNCPLCLIPAPRDLGKFFPGSPAHFWHALVRE